MQFKGKRYTRTVIKNNIVKVWNECTNEQKFDWYQVANNKASLLSYKYGIDKNKVIGIIAALSPVKRWAENLKIAEDLIKTGQAGHMKQFVNKGLDILNSDGSDESILKILRGEKISNFYLNIKYYDKSTGVTIDRHALSIALGVKIDKNTYRGITKKQYKFFSDCYIYAANILSVSPLLLQSATWVWIREQKYKTNQKLF